MKLRLGPLPRTDIVKVTIALPSTLKDQLDRYAQLHSATWHEPVDAAGLIPHMLQQFIAKDRGFRLASKERPQVRPDSPES